MQTKPSLTILKISSLFLFILICLIAAGGCRTYKTTDKSNPGPGVIVSFEGEAPEVNQIGELQYTVMAARYAVDNATLEFDIPAGIILIEGSSTIPFGMLVHSKQGKITFKPVSTGKYVFRSRLSYDHLKQQDEKVYRAWENNYLWVTDNFSEWGILGPPWEPRRPYIKFDFPDGVPLTSQTKKLTFTIHPATFQTDNVTLLLEIPEGISLIEGQLMDNFGYMSYKGDTKEGSVSIKPEKSGKFIIRYRLLYDPLESPNLKPREKSWELYLQVSKQDSKWDWLAPPWDPGKEQWFGDLDKE